MNQFIDIFLLISLAVSGATGIYAWSIAVNNKKEGMESLIVKGEPWSHFLIEPDWYNEKGNKYRKIGFTSILVIQGILILKVLVLPLMIE